MNHNNTTEEEKEEVQHERKYFLLHFYLFSPSQKGLLITFSRTTIPSHFKPLPPTTLSSHLIFLFRNGFSSMDRVSRVFGYIAHQLLAAYNQHRHYLVVSTKL